MFIRDSTKIYRHSKAQSKRMEKLNQANNQIVAGVAELVSDQFDFKAKGITGDEP